MLSQRQLDHVHVVVRNQVAQGALQRRVDLVRHPHQQVALGPLREDGQVMLPVDPVHQELLLRVGQHAGRLRADPTRPALGPAVVSQPSSRHAQIGLCCEPASVRRHHVPLRFQKCEIAPSARARPSPGLASPPGPPAPRALLSGAQSWPCRVLAPTECSSRSAKPPGPHPAACSSPPPPPPKCTTARSSPSAMENACATASTSPRPTLPSVTQSCLTSSPIGRSSGTTRTMWFAATGTSAESGRHPGRGPSLSFFFWLSFTSRTLPSIKAHAQPQLKLEPRVPRRVHLAKSLWTSRRLDELIHTFRHPVRLCRLFIDGAYSIQNMGYRLYQSFLQSLVVPRAVGCQVGHG
mmetsp:Transcript_55912/g.137351  ORF Transcript_55912/g.137351 Transcript_55912/m.137351 type:complete len:351 (+) Transcript_55912:2100-3152(+)